MTKVLRAYGLSFAGLLLLAAPGWVWLSLEARPSARSVVASVALGLLWDAPVYAVLALLLSLLAFAVGQGQKRVGLALLGCVVLGLWLAHVTAHETYVSRGAFPTWADTALMLRAPAMMESSVGMFLMPRNVAWLAWSVGVAAVVAKLWPTDARLSLARLVSLAACASVLGLAGWAFAQGSARSGPIHLETPAALLRPDMLSDLATCLRTRCRPGDAIMAAPLDGATVGHGAALLGFRVSGAEAPVLAPRSLPSSEWAGPRARPGAPLMRELESLSRALFANRQGGPVIVFSVLLEGLRADDIHALNPRAPRELSPFLSGLIESRTRDRSGVFASSQFWSAGLRTPHGVAAATCGLGTLPMGLALSRDLPDLSVRCLPDLLHDAGFRVWHYYGGALEVDGIGPFLERHVSRPAEGLRHTLKGSPRGAWGASDRSLFRAVARSEFPPHGSHYALVLSLSHHHPFSEPEDMSAEVMARADQASARAERPLRELDRRRLRTLAYTDDALREFFEELEAAGHLRQSIVSVAADHALPDRSLWSRDEDPNLELWARARVPWVLRIGETLLGDPQEPTVRSLRDLQDTLDKTPLSQNDLPTILLALLEHHSGLRELPLASAWHSMGGQTTSPWYEAPFPDAVLHGIHAGTSAYFLTKEGARAGPDEPTPMVLTDALVRRSGPSLFAGASALRALNREDLR